MIRRRSWFRAAMALGVAVVGAAGAGEPEPWAAAFAARWEAAARAVAAAPDATTARARCANLLDAGVDLAALTDQVALAVHASAAQRGRLAPAIVRKLTADCVAHRSDDAGAVFHVLGVRPSGTQLFVTADVSTPRKPGRRVVWRLRAPPGPNPKAIDVSLQGRGLVADVREALERLEQSRGDLDRAIAALGAN